MVYSVLVQLDPVIGVLIKASISPSYTPYFSRSVLIGKALHDALNHYVEPRTKSSTGDNGDLCVLWPIDYLFLRPCSQEFKTRSQFYHVSKVLFLNDERALFNEALFRHLKPSFFLIHLLALSFLHL